MKKKVLTKVGTMVITSALLATSPIPVLASGDSAIFRDGTGLQEDEGMNSVNSEVEPYGLFTTKYRVTASELKVRSGPGTKYAELGSIRRGTIIKVKSISNGWAKFDFLGKTGYSSAEWLEKV